ncbi:hypothetical protein [Aeromicrobium duanguangcaii]|uniref:Uncharacterized protein n=1 Tax=Aeromicrobium duanguangcaii TaxID=2968086 RepID=A0ABY5KDM8_9ACTN|nr:hypothetical protein [Aeromicrobium duanguangcaii]MCD9152796.1 hypothetical protein [Aeromicrobium duanguangcaii]UUI67222.1 hypothetical protein NP095_08350 [Aeromicrobium duanguangcaii]
MSPRAKPVAARARREKGTGSVTKYQTKSGLRWRYEINVPVEPGHPEAGSRSQTCAGFASYEEADEAITLVRADVIRKIPQAVGRDTFTPYARRWLDGHSIGNGTCSSLARRSRRRPNLITSDERAAVIASNLSVLPIPRTRTAS